ncbi:MAG: hypothetical protein C0404_03680 [Verrucomicrobia bacterium]|nr:hypothetical protein [Verrucomicrobiota bacterium]
MSPQSKKDPDGSLMYVVCSKCREFLDSKPGNLNSVSHGLCRKCFEEEMKLLADKAQSQSGTPPAPEKAT